MGNNTKKKSIAKNSNTKKTKEVKAISEKEVVIKEKSGSVKNNKGKSTKKESILKRFRNYLKNVALEMKKTKWPSKKNMISYSVATLLFILIFALFFTFTDVIIAAIKQVLR